MHKVPSDLKIPMATIWAYAWELQVALSALCSEQKTQTKAGVSGFVLSKVELSKTTPGGWGETWRRLLVHTLYLKERKMEG